MVRLVVGMGGRARAALENASRSALSSASSSESTMTPSSVRELTASSPASALLDDAAEGDTSSHCGTRGANNHDSQSGVDGNKRARAHSPLRSDIVLTSLATIEASLTTAR